MGWADAARKARQEESAFRARVRAGLEKLRQARAGRVPPGTDTKVLTDWNALAASAFLDGFAATGEAEYLERARRALACIWRRCWRGGVLYHVWDGREPRVEGFLSDHAYLAQAHWRAFETTGASEHLHRVGELLDLIRERFRDPEPGRLCDAPAAPGGPLLAVRDAQDGVLPSPGAVYARVLWNWSRLTGSPESARELDGLLDLESGAVAASPEAHPLLAGLFDLRSASPAEVVVAAPGSEAARPFLKAVERARFPGLLVAPLLADQVDREKSQEYALFAGRRSEGVPRAYLCAGGTCRPPFTSPEELAEALGRCGRR
jgi:uncharacterized protein YyaL (SSP411 family)